MSPEKDGGLIANHVQDLMYEDKKKTRREEKRIRKEERNAWKEYKNAME
jgi:hypothetical protein